jgi:hypothetical protein
VQGFLDGFGFNLVASLRCEVTSMVIDRRKTIYPQPRWPELPRPSLGALGVPWVGVLAARRVSTRGTPTSESNPNGDDVTAVLSSPGSHALFSQCG